MKSEIRIDTENADTVKDIVTPSLRSQGKVKVEVNSTGEQLVVDIKTDSLGALRGSTDNVFRLSSLAKKIYEA